MATTKKPKPNLASAADKMELVGPDDHLACYADIFTVATESGSGMVTIAFYQSEFPAHTGFGTRTNVTRRKAKFITSIVLAPTGVAVLLKALVDNQVAAGVLVPADLDEGAEITPQPKLTK